jgi:hypothetical protein
LANNFHFENNCAVLSVDGYPPGPFPTVLGMLKRNPRLQVVALHDATPTGCILAQKLATNREWFAGQVQVVDIGLRPSHAKPFEGLLLRSSTPVVQTGNGIRVDEAAWLASYVLELAVIRPEQLLKRLFRAMNRQYNVEESTIPVVGDGNGSSSNAGYSYVYVDHIVLSRDAEASDAGSDSFG